MCIYLGGSSCTYHPDESTFYVDIVLANKTGTPTMHHRKVIETIEDFHIHIKLAS